MAAMTLTHRPDAAIVRRVLNGRRDDFGILIQRHLNAVQAVAIAYVGPSPDADDIAQETFTKALESLDTLRDFGKFRSWLLSIARRLCIDSKRAKAVEVAIDPAPLADEVAVSTDQGREELRQILLGRIYALEPNAREVLLLHYYAGFSTREIAAETDLTQEAVKKRLQRARDALSRELSDDLKDLLTPEESTDSRARRIALGLAGVSVPWLQGTSKAATIPAFVSILSNVNAGWLAAAALVIMSAIAWQLWRAVPSTPAPANTTSLAANASSAQTVSTTPELVSDAVNPPATGGDPLVVAQAQDNDPPATAAKTDPGPLPPIGNILVVVYNEQGQPVPGARLIAERIAWEGFESPPADSPRKFATTDAHGRHYFTGIPIGDWIIQAHSEQGFDLGLAGLGLDSLTRQRQLRLQPADDVSGRVVDADGNPIAGALIYTYKSQTDRTEMYVNYRSSGRQYSGDDGRFTFPGLWMMPYQFYVVADGFAVYMSDWIQSGTDNVEFRLDVGETETVNVVDDNGDPLKNVKVVVASPDAYRDRHTAVTDEGGTAFFAHLRDTAYVASLWDTNWAARPTPVEVGSGETKITAEAAASVTGRITTRDGMPIANVHMRVDAPQRSGLNPITAITNDDGRYTLAGLAPGRYTLIGRHHGGYLPTMSAPPSVNATAGMRLANLDYIYEATGQMTGRVVNAEGAAVAGAEVRLRAERQGLTTPTATMSRSDGTFSFGGLLPGTQYVVWAKTDAQLSAPVGPFQLNEGNDEPLEVRVTDAASVSGVVVDSNGAPRAGLLVSADAPLSFNFVAQPAIGDASATSGEDGTFTIAGLYAGSYNVRASKPESDSYSSSNAQSVLLTPGERRSGLRVVWSDSRGSLAISGMVANTRGEPIVEAWVSANSSDAGMYGSARSDEHGRFTLAGLTPGTYDVRASAGSYSFADVAGVQAGTTGLMFRLPDLGDLRLRVLDAATGAPVTRIEYGFGDSVLPLRALGGLQEIAAPNGEYVLTDMNAGETSVLVLADGYAEHVARTTITPRDQGETSTTIRLTPGATINAVIVDASGKPVSGAVVMRDRLAMDPYSMQYYRQGETGADGRIRIQSLESKPYVFFITHEDFAPTSVQITPQPGVARNETWVLSAGGTLLGSVIADGKPAVDARVSVILAEGQPQFNRGAITDETGAFRIDGVSAGEHQVRVDTPGDSSYRWTMFTATIADGRENVLNATIPPGNGALNGRFLVNGANDAKNRYVVLTYEDGSGGYSVYAQADGALRVDNMPAGTLIAEAVYDDPQTDMPVRVQLSDPVQIRPNETTQLEINLTD